MDFVKPRVLIRACEVIIDCILLGCFYGTNSHFSNVSQSSDNFGQTTLIMFFILSTLLMVGEAMRMTDKFKIGIVGYNIVAFIFFLTSGIIILATWSNPPIIYVENHKSGGLATGSFCIIQCVVLGAGAFLNFQDSRKTE